MGVVNAVFFIQATLDVPLIKKISTINTNS